MKKDGAMGEARRAWKKAHPGFTGAIHDLIERSFDAGWEAALAQPISKCREGELVAALRSLETVTRSYLRYPLEGEEPGYDAKDVLAYCDEALAALAQGEKA